MRFQNPVLGMKYVKELLTPLFLHKTIVSMSFYGLFAFSGKFSLPLAFSHIWRPMQRKTASKQHCLPLRCLPAATNTTWSHVRVREWCLCLE